MRIWDLVPTMDLCKKHLLGEHYECHALWKIIHRPRSAKPGYWNHPEVKRWKGHELELYVRHLDLQGAMLARGYKHKTPLTPVPQEIVSMSTDAPHIVATREFDPPAPWDDQLSVLREKGCACRVPEVLA